MGTPDYIIGITNQIRKTIGKTFGDEVEVVLKEREEPSLWESRLRFDCKDCKMVSGNKASCIDYGRSRMEKEKVFAMSVAKAYPLSFPRLPPRFHRLPFCPACIRSRTRDRRSGRRPPGVSARRR